MEDRGWHDLLEDPLQEGSFHHVVCVRQMACVGGLFVRVPARMFVGTRSWSLIPRFVVM